MFRAEREVDYSYNFYKKPYEEIVECKKKNEYNPYVNNSGTVLGRLFINVYIFFKKILFLILINDFIILVCFFHQISYTRYISF